MQSHTLGRILAVSATLRVLRHFTLERSKMKPSLCVFAFPAHHLRTFRIRFTSMGAQIALPLMTGHSLQQRIYVNRKGT